MQASREKKTKWTLQWHLNDSGLLWSILIRDRKGTPKKFCDKDFPELSGELSGEICLKTLVLLGSALDLFRKFFGTVRAIFWVWGSFLAPDLILGMTLAVIAMWNVETLPLRNMGSGTQIPKRDTKLQRN